MPAQYYVLRDLDEIHYVPNKKFNSVVKIYLRTNSRTSKNTCAASRVHRLNETCQQCELMTRNVIVQRKAKKSAETCSNVMVPILNVLK